MFPTDPPPLDLLELSLFGPGVGECVLLHLPGGRWVVVDSCEDRGRPVALSALEALGVPLSEVALVVATHWHDDHVAGLAEVVRQAASATFACSVALQRDEFASLLASAGVRHRSTNLPSGLDELSAIMDTLQRRRTRPRWMNHDQVVLRGAGAVLSSLSPSDEAVSRGLTGLSALLPQTGEAIRAVPNLKPNELSVVLHLEVDQTSVLLGADLEVTRSPTNGWQAIVASPNRPTAPAHLFKVPHHGSTNGHLQAVWDELLTPDVIACLTPFRRSRLPRPEDLERLSHLAPGGVFLTAPVTSAPIRRDRAVERTLEQAGVKVTPEQARLGQVRVRFEPAKGVMVSCEIFGAALRV